METEKVATLHVQVRGGPALQIEGFPKGCARSVKGSIHVRAGTLELTSDELTHIQKAHKDVARRFTLVVTKPQPPKAEVKADAAGPEAAPESEAKAEDSRPQFPGPSQQRSGSGGKSSRG